MAPYILVSGRNDPVFPRAGALNLKPWGGANLLFGIIFAENFMKLRKLID